MGVRAMALRSYLDLKSEVWDKGICSGCGACVAVCPADALSFDEGEMVLAPKSNGYCKQATDGVSCGACYSVCPRIGDQPAETLGNYIELACARSAFEVPHKQSGGAVTAILANALDQGLIDAIVTVTEDRWTLKPSSVLITKSDVLVQQAGSRYSWWVPLLAALKHAVVERKFRRIAVIGVPCAVQAVACMRESDNDLIMPYGKAIRLVIGLFCTETFDYTALIMGKLRTHYLIEPHEIRKLDVKGRLEVLKHDGTTTIVPLAELETCIRNGCHYCTDLTAVRSDISAGAIGSPAGTTTLIIRTPTGKGFVDSAVQNQKLTLTPGPDTAAIERMASVKIRRNTKRSQ
jgi:coenzyme F420 hydrogenase subunit beta